MRYLSLFSGIEAASVAWKPLGWQCVGVAEIDPFPCAVLRHHYPGVPNLGSVTDITDQQIAALGPIDVVVGGSPCQDLSVAGKRAGLAGERSGLFHEQLRIFHAARHLCGARYLLWENVPGAFSSNRGRDFAVVVGEMAGCSLPVPPDGWGTEGVVLGEHGLVEWAVLDAQFFNVAQRRRRVFAVLDVGDWASRPPILLERDSLRGDSAPSREAGQGSTAGVIKGAAIGRQPHNGPQYGDAIADGSCYTLTTNEVHAVAHTLRGEGFDAGEDGAGRGTPLVPVAFGVGESTDVGHCLRSGASKADKHESTTYVAHPVAFSCKDYGADASDLAPTLRAMGHDGSHANGGGQVAVAFMADDYKDGGYEECDTARPLTTSADRTRAVPIAVAHAIRTAQTGSNGWGVDPDTAYTLDQSQGQAVQAGMAVRRLTPVECARLQGFSDSYLDITYRGKPAADGNKYKALGNSMAVPVMHWIGRQIEAAA